MQVREKSERWGLEDGREVHSPSAPATTPPSAHLAAHWQRQHPSSFNPGQVLTHREMTRFNVTTSSQYTTSCHEQVIKNIKNLHRWFDHANVSVYYVYYLPTLHVVDDDPDYFSVYLAWVLVPVSAVVHDAFPPQKPNHNYQAGPNVAI